MIKRPVILQEQVMQEHTENHEANTLRTASARIESELKKAEQKDLNDDTRNLLSELYEMRTALATMQDMLNLVWKRTERMHEQLLLLKDKTE